MRRLLSLALAAAVVFLAAAGEVRAQAVGDEAGFLAHLAEERSSQGLAALTSAADLQAVARQHAQRMAARGEPYHNPALTSEVGGWELVGENVGFGPNADLVHDAFMASAPHRANILDARFTQVGVGAVRDATGRLWVVEVFRRPVAAAPAPAPAPAAPTSPPPVTSPAPAPRPAPAPEPSPAPEPAPAPLPAPTTTVPPPPPAPTTNTVPAPAPTPPREVEVAGLVVARPAAVPPLDDLAERVPTAAAVAALLLAGVVALQGQTLRRLGLLP